MRRKNAGAIYAAAEKWRDECLLNDGSLFGGGRLWTKENFSDAFVDIATAHRDAKDFMQRLERQMKDMGATHCKLAAELLYVFYLCDDRRGEPIKKGRVKTAWGWSGDNLDDHPLFTKAHWIGVGGAGQAFSQQQGREFFTFVLFVKKWKELARAEQESLLASAPLFAERWDEWVQVWKQQFDWASRGWNMVNSGFRHQLAHLLFPDYFRPRFSKGNKVKFVKKMRGTDMSRNTLAEIDATLEQIREERQMQSQHDESHGYWLAGASWGDTDKTEEFVRESRWENGNADRPEGENYVSVVKQVAVGDKIAIKSVFVQKHGLPFDFGGKSCSVMRIKARGVVTANAGDGRYLSVDWEQSYKTRDWYRKNIKWKTVHELRTDKRPDKMLVDFVFNNAEQNYDRLINDAMSQNHIPLNQIFYGPPGTGKTYDTVNAALEILDGEFFRAHKNDRVALKKRFAELQEDGRVGFVTFHQSFGYEEFVEGIRPVMGDEQGEDVSYEVAAGVFKDIADKARENLQASRQKAGEITDDDVISEYFAYVAEKLQEEGGELPIYSGKHQSIGRSTARIASVRMDAHGTPRSFAIRYENTDPDTKLPAVTVKVVRRDYPQFKSGKIYKAKQIRPTQKSTRLVHGMHMPIFGVLHRIADFEKTLSKSAAPEYEPLQNYVIIIDEVNRGNVSRIFGELITLIEGSKRIGNTEETKVLLPYSGDEFGVPKNLYIIGTMNTADRSIALLDTALRRRFRFVEMMPDSELLESIEVEGVDIAKLLDAMNARIEAVYDRDHQIGHSFFMRLEESPELETLAEIFRHEILPLLQEYFYDDWEKIDLVLNKNGFLAAKNPPKMGGDAVPDGKKIWAVDSDALLNAANYQKIYADAVSSDDS